MKQPSRIAATTAVLTLIAGGALAQQSTGTDSTMANGAASERSPDSVTCADLVTMDSRLVPGVLYYISGYQQGSHMGMGSGGASASSMGQGSMGQDTTAQNTTGANTTAQSATGANTTSATGMQSGTQAGGASTSGTDMTSATAPMDASNSGATSTTTDSGAAVTDIAGSTGDMSGSGATATGTTATGSTTAGSTVTGSGTTGTTPTGSGTTATTATGSTAPGGTQTMDATGDAMAGTSAGQTGIVRVAGMFEIPVEQVMTVCGQSPDMRASDAVEQNRSGSGGMSATSSGTTTN